jgi:hypothetical protein
VPLWRDHSELNYPAASINNRGHGFFDATPHAITEHLNLDAAGQVKAPIDTVLFTDGIK